MQAVSSTSSLFQWSPIEYDAVLLNPIEAILKEYYNTLGRQLQHGSPDTSSSITVITHLQSWAGTSPQKHDQVQGALLYGILIDPPRKIEFLKYLHASVRDGYSYIIGSLVAIVEVSFSNLLPSVLKQIIWLLGQLLENNVNGLDTLITLLLRQLKSESSIALVDYSLSVLDLFSNFGKNWLRRGSSHFVPILFYAISKLLNPAKFLKQSLLVTKTNDLLCQLMADYPLECFFKIGKREFIRIIHDFNGESRVFKLWTSKIQQQLNIFSTDYLEPSSELLLSVRLSPQLISHLNFILTQVPFNHRQPYLKWFQERYLSISGSEWIIPDIIRYICNYCPTSSFSPSTVTPRWFMIAWLISLVAIVPNDPISANIKNICYTALFTDWLLFSPEALNPSNELASYRFEPAISLLIHCTRKNPVFVDDLIEGLFMLFQNYSLVTDLNQSYSLSPSLNSRSPTCSTKIQDSLRVFLEASPPSSQLALQFIQLGDHPNLRVESKKKFATMFAPVIQEFQGKGRLKKRKVSSDAILDSPPPVSSSEGSSNRLGGQLEILPDHLSSSIDLLTSLEEAKFIEIVNTFNKDHKLAFPYVKVVSTFQCLKSFWRPFFVLFLKGITESVANRDDSVVNEYDHDYLSELEKELGEKANFELKTGQEQRIFNFLEMLEFWKALFSDVPFSSIAFLDYLLGTREYRNFPGDNKLNDTLVSLTRCWTEDRLFADLEQLLTNHEENTKLLIDFIPTFRILFPPNYIYHFKFLYCLFLEMTPALFLYLQHSLLSHDALHSGLPSQNHHPTTLLLVPFHDSTALVLLLGQSLEWEAFQQLFLWNFLVFEHSYIIPSTKSSNNVRSPNQLKDGWLIEYLMNYLSFASIIQELPLIISSSHSIALSGLLGLVPLLHFRKSFLKELVMTVFPFQRSSNSDFTKPINPTESINPVVAFVVCTILEVTFLKDANTIKSICPFLAQSDELKIAMKKYFPHSNILPAVENPQPSGIQDSNNYEN